MSRINDGGPAYPANVFMRSWREQEKDDLRHCEVESIGGMSVRQVYARDAMKAIINKYGIHSIKGIAAQAFEAADAMIAFEANERGTE
ncbi:MAG: hypothetical protein ABIH23_19730 [bacterium]